VIPLPVTGGTDLSGLIEITRQAMEPAQQKRKIFYDQITYTQTDPCLHQAQLCRAVA
jgi:hypothetical protein